MKINKFLLIAFFFAVTLLIDQQVSFNFFANNAWATDSGQSPRPRPRPRQRPQRRQNRPITREEQIRRNCEALNIQQIYEATPEQSDECHAAGCVLHKPGYYVCRQSLKATPDDNEETNSGASAE